MNLPLRCYTQDSFTILAEFVSPLAAKIGLRSSAVQGWLAGCSLPSKTNSTFYYVLNTPKWVPEQLYEVRLSEKAKTRILSCIGPIVTFRRAQ